MLELMVALVAAEPQRIVVRFESDAAMAAGLETVEQKAQVVKTVPGKLSFAVVMTDDPDALRNLPGVLYVEKDQPRKALLVPDDPIWDEQWGPENINCPQAWDITVGDTAVKVGILDEGIDYEHPDLADYFGANPGYDFVDNDPDPAPDWGLYHEIHGQHVCGIAAAITDNGQYMAGVAKCHLYALRVLDSLGSGWASDIAEAILWAADSGLDIINMSLGGSGASIEQEACSTAYDAGVLLIAASGNNGANNILYPAAYPTVVAVGATAVGDTLWESSNYGSQQELVAPGAGIVSILPYGNIFYGETLRVSGTSMAAPHVAGVAALVKAHNPSMTNTEIRTLLQETAEDLGDPGWDMYYGYGKVDALHALMGVSETGHGVRKPAITGPTVITGPADFALSLPEGQSSEAWLMDVSGRRIRDLKLSDDGLKLDPAGLTQGAYFILVQVGDLTISRPVLIRSR